MEKQEAIREIATKVRLLESKRTLDEGMLTFYVEKLGMDILDHCHRADFPDALIYSAVDLIRKRFADEDAEFKFAVANIDPTGCLAELDFATLKPKLNLYRKVVSWA